MQTQEVLNALLNYIEWIDNNGTNTVGGARIKQDVKRLLAERYDATRAAHARATTTLTTEERLNLEAQGDDRRFPKFLPTERARMAGS